MIASRVMVAHTSVRYISHCKVQKLDFSAKSPWYYLFDLMHLEHFLVYIGVLRTGTNVLLGCLDELSNRPEMINVA